MKGVLTAILVLAVGLVVTDPALARDDVKPPAAAGTGEPGGPPDQLRVTVVVSRLQGATTISRAPYTFLLAADGQEAEVKMGVELPVPVRSHGDETPSAVELRYKNVGTNISCVAREVAEGLYQLRIKVETSSVLTNREGRPGGPDLAGKPLFNSFWANHSLRLLDGQSEEVVAATDPVTGEVVKIGVSLEVKKEGPQAP